MFFVSDHRPKLKMTTTTFIAHEVINAILKAGMIHNIYHMHLKIVHINEVQTKMIYLGITVILLAPECMLLEHPLNRLCYHLQEMEWLGIINRCRNKFLGGTILSSAISNLLKIWNPDSATNTILCQLWLFLFLEEILRNTMIIMHATPQTSAFFSFAANVNLMELEIFSYRLESIHV